MTELRREIRWEPGYDKREEGQGVHGLSVRWLLHGDVGTIQFLFYTGWHPGIVSQGPWGPEVPFTTERPDYLMAADLGHHWDKPTYDGEMHMDNCDVRPGGECFYDGSGLNAGPVLATLLTEGEEAVWARMAAYYDRLREEVTT